MQEEKLTITISPGGQIEYEVRGVKVEACLETAKFLDDLGSVKSSEPTDEMHEEVEETLKVEL